MERLTKKEIKEWAEKLAQTTNEYTSMYFEVNKSKELNRELWGALHIGFVSSMKIQGHHEDDIDDVLEKAQSILLGQHGSVSPYQQ